MTVTKLTMSICPVSQTQAQEGKIMDITKRIKDIRKSARAETKLRTSHIQFMQEHKELLEAAPSMLSFLCVAKDYVSGNLRAEFSAFGVDDKTVRHITAEVRAWLNVKKSEKILSHYDGTLTYITSTNDVKVKVHGGAVPANCKLTTTEKVYVTYEMNKSQLARTYQDMIDATLNAGELTADDYPTSVQQAYQALGKESQKLRKQIKQEIRYVLRDEAYITIDQMFYDISNNNLLLISDTCHDNILLPRSENIAFRIIHDITGHYNEGERNNFSWQGELHTWHATKNIYSPIARRALFTEIVGQSAYRSRMGFFPTQIPFLYPEEVQAEFEDVWLDRGVKIESS